MSDFDPVRAAAGETVQFCKTGGVWVDVHYIGLTKDGTPAVQFEDGHTIQSHALRMKPIPSVKWVLEFDTQEHAEDAVRELVHVGWSGQDVPGIKRVETPHPDL